MPRFIRFLVLAAVVSAASACAADGLTVAGPDIEHGKATFNTMCSVCHATQKTGGLRASPGAHKLLPPNNKIILK